MSITANFPAIRPTLNLDFVNSRTVDPRITFTRASTATYYDGKTFAKAEENLLVRSQEFDNAAWVKSSATVTANTGAAPDGTTTADTLTASGANGSALQTFTAMAQSYTFSLWVRRTVGTGTVEITADGTTWSAITISGTWARFSVTVTPSAGSRTAGIRLATSGDAVEIWGAQLEQRSSVTAYTPTTDRPITRYVPQLMTAAANTPRIDFDPVTGACRGLLIEEQRTNLLLRSQEFDNAVWAKTVSVVANSAVAPDGTLTADKVVPTASTGIFIVGQDSPHGTTATFSVYAKKGEYNFCTIFLRGPGIRSTRTFNLTTGEITNPYNANSTFISAQAINVGNGWWRLTLSATSANFNGVAVGPALDTTNNHTDSGQSFTGDGVSGIYIWGAQLEVGAFPTSYIPTTSSQVTRSADSAVMTGANFSSWYRQDAGSLYVEFRPNQSLPVSGVAISPVAASNNSFAQRFGLVGSTGTAAINFDVVANSTQQRAVLGNFVAGFNKAAGAFAVGSGGGSLNGATAVASTVNVLPVDISRLDIGSAHNAAANLNGHIRRITYWPVRLPNTVLQAITA